MSAYRSKKSPADKLRLWRTRGLCPNRKELINEFFTPVFGPHAIPTWIINFKFDKEYGSRDQIKRLPNLFISATKKIFFIPPKPDDSGDLEELMGYVLFYRRSGQDNGELVCGDLKLYPLYWEEIQYYFPEITSDQYHRRTQTYPISKQEFRLKCGKIRKLLYDKIEKDDHVIFKANGFTRLRYQTTGKLWGVWED